MAEMWICKSWEERGKSGGGIILKVSISECAQPNSEEEIFSAVKELLGELDGIDSIVKEGQRVIIKPNLCIPTTEPGVTTNKLVLKALVKAVLEVPNCKVAIGENGAVGRNINEIFKINGITELAEELNIELIDLGSTETTKVEINNHPIIKDIEVSAVALNTDILINVPVMKSHMHTRVSLALKNLKGCLPHKSMKKMHLGGVEEGIPILEQIFKPSLNIIDGTIAHEGMGPIHGHPKPMHCLVGSKSALACDVIGAALMGISPSEVKHLCYAVSKYGGSLNIHDYEYNKGLFDRLKSEFIMPPTDLREAFGVHVVSQDTCSGCASAIIGCLARLKKYHDLDLVKDLSIIVGQRVESISIPTKPIKMVIGSCLHKFKEEADIFVPGCPPPDWDIMGRIYRYHNIPVKDEFYDRRMEYYEKL